MKAQTKKQLTASFWFLGNSQIQLFKMDSTLLQCLLLILLLLQAWVTLGRAQLNYGEPDSAIESLDRALAIKV